MTIFLDYRSSVNASTFIPPPGLGTLVPSAASSFIGGIGLIVGTATNVRADLWATVGLLATTPVTNVRLFIVRNAPSITSPADGTEIFSTTFTLDTTTTKVITINAADINAAPGPVPGQINYALFAEWAPGGAVANVTRVGPEVFTGMAVTG